MSTPLFISVLLLNHTAVASLTLLHQPPLLRPLCAIRADNRPTLRTVSVSSLGLGLLQLSVELIYVVPLLSLRHCVDVFLPACRYDIRFVAVCEISLPYDGTAPTGWQSMRSKKRHCWSDPGQAWQADFTIVDTDNSRHKTTVHEIELELKAAAVDALLKQTGDSELILSDLTNLLFQRLIPADQSQSRRDDRRDDRRDNRRDDRRDRDRQSSDDSGRRRHSKDQPQWDRPHRSDHRPAASCWGCRQGQAPLRDGYCDQCWSRWSKPAASHPPPPPPDVNPEEINIE